MDTDQDGPALWSVPLGVGLPLGQGNEVAGHVPTQVGHVPPRKARSQIGPAKPKRHGAGNQRACHASRM